MTTEVEARQNRDALADPQAALDYVRRRLDGADEDGMVIFVVQAVRALVGEVERLRAERFTAEDVLEAVKRNLDGAAYYLGQLPQRSS